jgi:hypothetical protein
MINGLALSKNEAIDLIADSTAESMRANAVDEWCFRVKGKSI